MDDVESIGDDKEDEVFDAEVFDAEVFDNDPPPDEEASAGALAALARGGTEASADALDAMALGEQPAPVDAIAAAKARQKPDTEDALANLASGEPVAESDDDDAPVNDGEAAVAMGLGEGESIHVDPERIKAARQQRQRLVTRGDDLSFKKTMIPLLLTVGLLLLGIAGLTAVMTADSDDGAPANMMEEYGSLLIWAALPLGLILIGGAVMFHMEVRRRQESKQQDR